MAAEQQACVYTTDPNWIAVLHSKNIASNVNFWRKDRRTVHLETGSYFYFKLRGGLLIAGRGVFRAQEEMSLDEAWDRFGYGNGANSKEQFEKRSKEVLQLDANQPIKCIILDDLELISDEQPKLAASDWPQGIMGGKYFRAGALTYLDRYFLPKIVDGTAIMDLLLAPEGLFDPASIQSGRELTLRAIAMRRGQPEFRRELFRAYNGFCALSETNQAEALEAAHIFPYAGAQTNTLQNGILLRADLHTLFDLGLWTITQDYRVRLAASIRSRAYRDLDGSLIRLPSVVSERPSAQALEYHRTHIFRI